MSAVSFSQDAARKWTVQLSAEINEAPSSITLKWVESEEPGTTYIF